MKRRSVRLEGVIDRKRRREESHFSSKNRSDIRNSSPRLLRSIGFRTRLCLAVSFGAIVALMAADEWKLPTNEPKLKVAPGSDLVSANCQICHSADYIFTQPPMNRTAWSAAVQKMREKYGAPLPPDRVDAIVDYLVANYGRK